MQLNKVMFFWLTHNELEMNLYVRTNKTSLLTQI